MANAVETPSQNNLMTEGSIVKSLLLFALPLIFGNLLQQLYNTADSIIVGNFVGANALAAVGSSGSPIYLLIGFSQGLAVGAGNAAGANSGIDITGLDGTPDGYEAIKDGRITGTVAQAGGLMASSGVEAAVTLLDGGPLEHTLTIADSVWLDSSNVAEYEYAIHSDTSLHSLPQHP